MIDLVAFTLYSALLDLDVAKREWRAASEACKDTWRREAHLVLAAWMTP